MKEKKRRMIAEGGGLEGRVDDMSEDPDFEALAAEIDAIAKEAKLDAMPAGPDSPAYIVDSWEKLVTACRTQLRPEVTARRMLLRIAIGLVVDVVEVSPARDRLGKICFGIWFRVGTADLVDLAGLSGWVGETFAFGAIRVRGTDAYLHVALRAADLSFSRFSSMVKFAIIAGIDAKAIFVRGLDNRPPTKEENFGGDAIAASAENVERANAHSDLLPDDLFPDEAADGGNFNAAGTYNAETASTDQTFGQMGPTPAPRDDFANDQASETDIDGLDDPDHRVISWNDLIANQEGDAQELQFGFEMMVVVNGQHIPLSVTRNVLPSGEDSAYLSTTIGESTPRLLRLTAEAAANEGLGGVVSAGGEIAYVHSLELAGLTQRLVLEQETSLALSALRVASRAQAELDLFGEGLSGGEGENAESSEDEEN